MSIPTIIGLLFGLGLVAGAVFLSGGDPLAFVSVPSIMIVIGGTLAAGFIGFQARYVILSLKEIGQLLVKEKINRAMLTVETGKIIRWGYLVKKHGILALEREIKSAKQQDHFLNYGVELVITGYTGDEVRGMLSAAADGTMQRKMVSASILKTLASVSPAFGMIGTLIGLIIILQKLVSDPEGLGPGLALALVTTLYGVIMQRLIFSPAASKVEQKAGILRFRNFLVTEGFAMLAEHRSPRYIQDRMNSYLDPEIHYSIDKKGGASGGGQKRAQQRKAA